MAKGGVVGFGIFLIIVAVIGVIIPIGDYTIPQGNDLCKSGIGQLGQLFSNDARENCLIFNYLFLGIIVFGGLGFILMIVGAVIPNSKKAIHHTKEVIGTEHQETPLDILKKRYAKGEITQEEFDKMKDNLD